MLVCKEIYIQGVREQKESGKMYVRTLPESIEEFNSHKIIQSLEEKGCLPDEPFIVDYEKAKIRNFSEDLRKEWLLDDGKIL